jgi:hypothetical protein
MRRRWLGIAGWLVVSGMPGLGASASAQQAPADGERGPFARIAIMRALDGHAVEWEEGYIRHLDWHRQARDPFAWYSYSVWASSERQRWIIYATFGHTAAGLSNPVSPADDERDNQLNVLPHAQFLGNWIYEFLPALSRGTGVPTPTMRAELTTVEVMPGREKQFEAALAMRQSALQAETLWYRLVVGGNPPRYLRLCPRGSLAAIFDDPAGRALPDSVIDLVSRVTVETLNLRPTMLVNVTPVSSR